MELLIILIVLPYSPIITDNTTNNQIGDTTAIRNDLLQFSDWLALLSGAEMFRARETLNECAITQNIERGN